MRLLIITIITLVVCSSASAQIRMRGNVPSQQTLPQSNDIDYSRPKEYEIGGVTMSGGRFLDNNAIINLSGLVVGEKIQIPGEKLSGAIQKLWKQGLFDDVAINITRIEGNLVFFDIVITERPRLSRFTFSGIRKSEADEIRDKIKLVTGKVVNDNLVNNTTNSILKYYREKGFLNATVEITEQPDTILTNSVLLRIKIDRNKRIKINDVIITGNDNLKTRKVRKLLKDTKKKGFYRIFSSSKFQEKTFEADQMHVIDKYNELGFRDAKILRDTVYRHNHKTVNVELDIYEGPKYYFGNINFVGNTKYTTEYLNGILSIEKGDVYDRKVLQTRIEMNPNGRDIASLYLDDGYLFFQCNPVSTS
jgi:outer membrane protein insertion porin family